MLCQTRFQTKPVRHQQTKQFSKFRTEHTNTSGNGFTVEGRILSGQKTRFLSGFRPRERFQFYDNSLTYLHGASIVIVSTYF